MTFEQIESADNVERCRQAIHARDVRFKRMITLPITLVLSLVVWACIWLVVSTIGAHAQTPI